MCPSAFTISFFFFNDTATTEIYTLSLHDALPICTGDRRQRARLGDDRRDRAQRRRAPCVHGGDRKSTRLNSSHVRISYAVFCLKKKKRVQAAANAADCGQNLWHVGFELR